MRTIREKYKHNKDKLIILTDQAVVSGGNFLLVFFLSRRLSGVDFGWFAFIWLVVLFIASIQQSLIIAPLLTKYSKTNEGDRQGYVRSLSLINFVFAIACGVISFAVVFFSGMGTSPDFFGVVYLVPLLISAYLLQMYFRKLLVVLHQYKALLLFDVLVYTLMVIGFAVIEMSLLATLVILSIAFVTAVLLFTPKVNIIIVRDAGWRPVFRSHWKFSKWLLCTNIAQTFTGNSLVMLSTYWIGIEMLGVIRVYQNIMGVLHVFFLALENYMPVNAAKILVADGKDAVIRFIKSVSLKGMIIVFLITLPLILFPEMIIGRLYKDAHLTMYSWMFLWLTGLYYLIFLSYPLRFALRTFEQTKSLFIAYVLGSIVSVPCALLLISHYKVEGLFLTMLVSQLVMVLSYLWSLKKSTYENSSYSIG